jgi:predicted nucleic acid-binding Zn ribbon protein
MPEDPEKRLARRPRPASGPVEDYESPDDDPEAPSEEDIARFSDVTVKCPECGTELFDDVAVCWKCGRALSETDRAQSKKILWIMVGVITIVGVFLLYTRFF